MKKNKVVILRSLDELLEEIKARKTDKTPSFVQTLEFKTIDGELFLDFDGGNQVLPIRETALPSILARMGISGKTFYEMSDSELEQVFKITKNYMADNGELTMVNIMVSDGCVNSINSGLYAHIPMSEILEETLNVVQPLYKTEVKLEASVGYDVTHVKFHTDKTYTFNQKPRKLLVTLTNSENGTSCVRYGAYIKSSDGLIPVMSDIAVMHKGDDEKGYQRVLESTAMLDGVIYDAIKGLRALQKIEINYVARAIEACGKRCGLPKKYVEVVKKEFVNTKTCLASELYEAFSNAISNQENLATYERYKNDVVKLINFDWDSVNQK